MNDLHTYWKEKIGANVIFTGELKALDKDTIGVLVSISAEFAVIDYPQNHAFQQDTNGDWKPIKGVPNKVSGHSCKLSEIKLH